MNGLLLALGAGGGLILVLVVGFFWYYGSPKFTDVGYRPSQPIDYSHKLHAGDLGMDCRYCHSQVEQSRHANLPATSVCMNCHSIVGTDNEKLLPLRESWANQEPIEWNRVHMLPDYAYFDHSAHLRAGVSCLSCHGNVAEMEVVSQKQPLSMGWCLDCHRNPDPHLRPPEEVTNMYWKPPADYAEFVKRFKEEKKINPPENCSACHR
ncbi:cytochrome c family protein [bacterium]|nr:cytochrome c family protein [bacterium]